MCVDYRYYYAHRLAWFYHYGEWPEGEIDHLNRNKTDNRIANLRDATHSVNVQNQLNAPSHNTSGLMGAMWNSQKQKWQAAIVTRGRRKHLGFYSQPIDAHKAYMAAKRRLHSVG